jgi:hypothetical protein
MRKILGLSQSSFKFSLVGKYSMHCHRNARVGFLATFFLMLSSVCVIAQDKSPVQKKSSVKELSSAQEKEKSEKTIAATSRYLRIERDAKNEPVAMQTSIVRMTINEGPYKGAVVDLIGAVHIAHKEYFQELNKKFKEYDVVLYELVADPEVSKPVKQAEGENVRHPVGAVQMMMKDMLGLEFQLDVVNYNAKNFVHADMSPSEFMADMKNRGDGFASMFARMMGSSIAAQSAQAGKGQDINMLMAMFSKDPELKMRQAMAEQFENMEVQLAGLSDESGRSTLVTERNRKAMEVLERELKAGKLRMAIFYGAAHLPDFEKKLVETYKASVGKPEWITAWRLK